MILLDYLFGWLLWLPSDLTLLVTALLTGLVLTLVRKWTTDQALLGRVLADNRRLAALISQAKRAGNKEALTRYRQTKAQVGMLKFRQEGKPLLVALLPIALLATWAFVRLEFLPPQPGETVTAIAHAPVTAAGELVHLVPTAGVTAVNGWVKQLAVAGHEATATWQLRFAEPVGLTLRGRDAQLELILRERRLFGLVPGWPQYGLPAWLVGYLLIVLPLTHWLRKACGVF